MTPCLWLQYLPEAPLLMASSLEIRISTYEFCGSTSIHITAGFYNKTPQTMWFKPQKFISHNSGRWKSHIREPAWFGSDESSLLGSRLPTSCYILTWQRGKQTLFQNSTNPFVRALPWCPKAPPPNTITWGIRISTYRFWGGTNIQTIAITPQNWKQGPEFVHLCSCSIIHNC